MSNPCVFTVAQGLRRSAADGQRNAATCGCASTGARAPALFGTILVEVTHFDGIETRTDRVALPAATPLNLLRSTAAEHLFETTGRTRPQILRVALRPSSRS